jgi:SAM-dependent methyltransferase
MLNPALRSAIERLLPAFLKNALNPFEAKMHSAVEAFAKALPDGASVLDAGAGESRYKPLFKRVRYTAIDLAVGDKTWNYGELDLLGDLEKLPLRDNCFDAAINIVTLEHVKNPQAVICELARTLRPSGRLLLVAPMEWEVHQAPNDYFRYTRYGIAHLLNTAGLSIRRLDPVGGFFCLMARRSINFLGFFQGGLKWILFALLAPFFGFLLPLALYAIDGFDRDRDFTLGYICEAVKN